MNAIDNVYVAIAILLLFGLILGHLAKRIKLPSITGNILAGILLGPLFHIIDTTSSTMEVQFEPMVNVALSLIAISIGSHLKFRRLRNAIRRILTVGSIQMFITPIIVFSFTAVALIWAKPFANNLWESAMFMGALALATAPATILHVVKEAQAHGVFVKTLIAVVVFNNVASIFLFEICRHFLVNSDNATLLLIAKLFGSIFLGVGVAFLLKQVWKRTPGRKQTVTFTFASLVIAYGLALQLNLSPVLVHLSLGITLANLTDRNKILDIFEDFEGLIFTVFFTLMGTQAHFAHFGTVGLIATIYFLTRTLGNFLTVSLSSKFVRLPKKVKRHLALSLTPHAGLTVGLVVSLRAFDKTGLIAQTIIPVVLLAVTFSEVIGPLILRFSLHRSGEEGRALPRLIDFLQEEYIHVDIQARDRSGVIEELSDILFKSRRTFKNLDKKAFLKGVLEREERGDTSITPGLAIPHFTVEDGPKVMGVMGIIRHGVEWSELAKNPVHVVILIAIPPNHHKQHLGALSTIAKLFRKKSVSERQLHLAKTASDVYEALADQDFESLNHIFEEEATELIPENPELAERFRVQALSSRKLRKVRKQILDKS